MKKIFTISCFIWAICFSSQLLAQKVPAAYTKKVLFVPLDTRPPCLEFTEKTGLIGDAEIISPPAELLGIFTTPGQSERINEWILSQDLTQFDAAIIVIDMIAYGGLVASRVHDVGEEKALKRMDVIARMRAKAPKLKIYAQNVVMRLAPTPHGKNEAYRVQLANWAHVCVLKDEKSIAQTKALEAEIPAEVLNEYKTARKRNLNVNLKAIDQIAKGQLNYLILSQDDASQHGIHVADRELLTAEIKKRKLTDKIAVQPGTDEVSMLLLARTLSDAYKVKPTIKAVFSSQELADKIMPFEDKPLKQTVSFHISATGATEVRDEKKADVLFYVFASRKETGRAVTFADEIETQLKKGARIIVADIDPIGDVQGGDIAFSNELIERGLLQQLHGYASWNTAGNTIGTALPHGVVFTIAEKTLLKKPAKAANVVTAQSWFTLHRILDDYYFHNIIREKANELADQAKRSATILTPEKRQLLEAFCLKELQQSLDHLYPHFFEKNKPAWAGRYHCGRPTDLWFELPWNRTFEAALGFQLNCNTN